MKTDSSIRSLAEVEARRAVVLRRLRKQRARLAELNEELFALPKAEGRIGSLLANADKVLSVYDGVMLGLKVAGQLKRFFRKRKK